MPDFGMYNLLGYEVVADSSNSFGLQVLRFPMGVHT